MNVTRKFWFYVLWVVFAVVVMAGVAKVALATDKPKDDGKPTATATANVTASSTVHANSGGGAGYANLNQSIGGDEMLALSVPTAEAPRIAPPCWRPADKAGRPLSVLFFAVGGRVVPDPECMMRERAKLLIEAGRADLAVKLLMPDEPVTATSGCAEFRDTVLAACVKK